MASHNPGSTTTAIFRFGEDAAMEPLIRGAGGARAHVLIVDDNETNRQVLAALCDLFDCTYQTARDGLEAVETFATAAFDLILMDIQMPRMDGIEATCAIRRASESGRWTPILAVTANAEPSDVRAYLAIGMDGVVAKPIEAGRLLNAMLVALKTPRRAPTTADHREAS